MSSPQPQSVPYKYFDLVMAFFVTILVVSNIASSAKIVDPGFSLFGIRLAFDGGTILFPLAYVLGDILTEVYGFKAARRTIWAGFAALALSALVFFVLRILPPQADWEATTGTVAYNNVLGGMSTGGIVLASLLAYLVGEFSNSVVLSKVKVLMKGKLYWVRSVGSSIVGHLLDTLVFISMATVLGVFPREIFLSLVLTNYLIKMAVEIVVYPVNYMSIHFLKKKEGIDVYDVGVKYNPVGR